MSAAAARALVVIPLFGRSVGRSLVTLDQLTDRSIVNAPLTCLWHLRNPFDFCH